MTASPALINRFKAATRRVIEAAGGLSEASDIAGLSTTHLSRCQAAAMADLLPTSALLALAEHTGCDAFAEVLAGVAGCSLRVGPDAPAAAAIPAAVDALSEAAEFTHVIAQALADGVITPAEQATIRRVRADLLVCLQALDAAMPGEAVGRQAQGVRK